MYFQKVNTTGLNVDGNDFYGISRCSLPVLQIHLQQNLNNVTRYISICTYDFGKLVTMMVCINSQN